jgi:hypothetical protein
VNSLDAENQSVRKESALLLRLKNAEKQNAQKVKNKEQPALLEKN